MHFSKSHMKSYISVLYGVVLTLLFFTIFVIAGLSIGVFNDKSIHRSLSESKYFYQIYDELNEKAKEIVKESGLSISVLENAITLDLVYTQGKYYANDSILGKQPTIETELLEHTLTDNINQYLVQRGIEPKEKDFVKGVVNRLSKEYKNSLECRFFGYYAEWKNSFYLLTKFLIPVVFILIGIICYFMFKSHGYNSKGVWYLVYAFMAATIILAGLTGYLLMISHNEALTVAPDYYREFLLDYFKWDSKVFLLISGFATSLSIIMVGTTQLKDED